MNDKINQLNLIRQNVRRIVYIGIASPSKYKELNQNLEMLFRLENGVKQETTEFLKELEDFKIVLKEKIEKENKKHIWIKRIIKAYLFAWLMKK